MAKLIYIDTDLQYANRIFKSDTDNKVRQITEKAQNIAFSQTDTNKQPIYNYGGWYEFRGNDRIQSNIVNLNLGTEFSIEFWFRPQSFEEGAIQILYRIGEATTSAYCYFSVNSGTYGFTSNLGNIAIPSYGIPAPSLNTWHHLYWSVKSGLSYAYYDGYLITYGGFSISNVNSTISIGENYNGLYGSTCDISNFIISDKAAYSGALVNGTKVFTPIFNIGYQYNKRYLDNTFRKFYMSSKYLYNANIDSANNIIQIKSNIGTENEVRNLSGVQYSPSWTNRGIIFNRSETDRLESWNTVNNNGYYATESSLSNVLLSMWHKKTSDNSTGNQTIIRIFTDTNEDIMALSTLNPDGYYSVFDGTSNTLSETFPINTWNHICVIKKGTKLYLLINGYLKLISTFTTETFTNKSIRFTIGNYTLVNFCNMVIDDLLIEHHTLTIDPTNFSVSEKLFEPPLRGGFDGEFVTAMQKPYKEWQIDDLIYNKGYIPIATASEFNNLRSATAQVFGSDTKYQRTYTSGLDKKYIQLKNIDLSIYSNFTKFTTFTGTYDGNNYNINNLTITVDGSSQTAIFSGLNSATGAIKNLMIYGNINQINAGNIYYTSSVCGYLSNGTIENCHFYGTVTSASGFVGGIVGSANIGKIKNCSNNGVISGKAATGGIIGSIDSSSVTLENCTNYGNIYSTNGSYTGGIVGRNVGGIIKKSKNFGQIDTTQYYSGGLMGSNESGGLVNDCYSTGSVNCGLDNSGGFVGSNVGATSTITNCYSSGQATGDTINGFCSLNSGTITNCYWDTQTSGKATSTGGTGKTTTELQMGAIPDSTIFINWTPTIWLANTSTVYPTLSNGSIKLT